MKKVTMLVFILGLCIAGIASAVEVPASIAVCPPDAGVGDTVTLTAYDVNGDMVDLSQFGLVDMNFEGSDVDPSNLIFGEEPGDYDAVLVDGAAQFTMLEEFYNHNRWVIGGFTEGEEGSEWMIWLAAPEELIEGCDDCGEEINNWPPEFILVADAIAAGGSDGFKCAEPTIVVGSGEVAEEGATSADLLIQLDRNPTADVTFTISGPLWEADPNFADPETFSIDGAVNGVKTVVVPTDSNSVTFTVTAFDDEVIEGNLGYQLAVESTMEAGAGYDPNLVIGDSAKVAGGLVTVIDNDVRTIVVDPDFVEGLTENDPGVWVPVNVTLSHQPVGVINVAVAWGEELWAVDQEMVETDADLDDPNALQFDASNWDVAQTISFAAIDNDWLTEVGISHIPAQFTLTPAPVSIEDDPEYDPETGIEPGAVIELLVEDNECGSYGFDDRDYNEDCLVNLADFAVFAEGWMLCTDPGNPACAVVE